jgi:hypothetical protein
VPAGARRHVERRAAPKACGDLAAGHWAVISRPSTVAWFCVFLSGCLSQVRNRAPFEIR